MAVFSEITRVQWQEQLFGENKCTCRSMKVRKTRANSRVGMLRLEFGLMGGVQCEGREEKGKEVRADLERPVCLARSWGFTLPIVCGGRGRVHDKLLRKKCHDLICILGRFSGKIQGLQG